MTSALAPIEVSLAETEAFKELLSRVGRKAGKIPPELMVSHVLGCVPEQEWPTRVDAMEAVLRRMESIRRDNLRVEARPAEGRLLGLYITRRSGSGSRPYRTVLLGVDPIEGRCDCPDFLKNSLGLCKHVLAVLEHLHARPRLLAAGDQGARVERRFTSERTSLAPSSPADRNRRLAGSRRVERRLRGRQGTVGSDRPGSPMVPLEPGWRCDL